MAGTIPFITRTLPTLSAPSLLAETVLAEAVKDLPIVSEWRMLAKKGVPTWDAIGKAPVASLGERVEATCKLVDHFITPQWLDNLTTMLKKNMGQHSKLSILFTRAYEEGSLNLIPPAMAAKIEKHLKKALPTLEISINRDILQASKANRTQSITAATILGRQQIFEGPVACDAAYLLLDEHIESGATLCSLENHIRQAGGHVAAIATLTRNPASDHIRILPATLSAIDHALVENATIGKAIGGEASKKIIAAKVAGDRKSLHNALANVGLNLQTLTNSEGLALVAHLTQDEVAFDSVLRHAGTNLEEYRRKGADYICDMLHLPAKKKTVDSLVTAMHQDLGENYRYLGNQRAASNDPGGRL